MRYKKDRTKIQSWKYTTFSSKILKKNWSLFKKKKAGGRLAQWVEQITLDLRDMNLSPHWVESLLKNPKNKTQKTHKKAKDRQHLDHTNITPRTPCAEFINLLIESLLPLETEGLGFHNACTAFSLPVWSQPVLGVVQTGSLVRYQGWQHKREGFRSAGFI